MNKPRTLAVRALFLVAFTALPLDASAAAGERSAAARGATTEVCAWDRPGHDPFMGDVVAAVDRYQDIPVEVRKRLKARMLRRDYDDVVSIRRDSIAGRAGARYGSSIRDMHFGRSRVCATVSRAAWTAQMQERGLVYCEEDQCILVPTVCRNVSRITRAQVARERAEGDVPEPVATFDVEPALVPFGGLPGLALDASPSFESPADGHASDGFAYGTHAGGSGSFAAGWGGGSGSGSGRAVAARSPELADGFGPAFEASMETRVDVAITPVPEPETWALMLGGFAALAAWRRRRP